MENGLVLIEIVKRDSPIDARSAIELLSRLRRASECAATVAVQPTTTTILAQTLRQLPTIVDAMNVSASADDNRRRLASTFFL